LAKSQKLQHRDERIGHDLTELVSPFGYKPCQDLKLPGRYTRAWWFHRSGSQFRSELIFFVIYSRPNLVLEPRFLGAKLSLEALTARGAEGNVVGLSPFHYQFYALGIPASELLGQVIYLKPEELWPVKLEALKREFQRIHPGIWAELWEGHHRNVERGIDTPMPS